MKPASTPTPPSSRPWTGSPYRRRRILFSLLLAALAALAYLALYGPPPSLVALLSLSLPAHLQDRNFGLASSPAGRVALAKPALPGSGPYAAVRELDALVHFLTAHPERRLDEYGPQGSVLVVDPGAPIDLRVYEPAVDAATMDARRWKKYVEQVRERYPVVVFSKTTCPYSMRAKQLLRAYDISPPPKIVEINERTDGAMIQAILARLTGRKTVPNILLKGTSIGGSDDIHVLHDDHKLKNLLESHGLVVRGETVSH